MCYQVNQQWLHYERGDFSTSGYPGDQLYPKNEIGTTLTSNYSRPAPSKQELLCGNVRRSQDPERRRGDDDGVDPSSPPPPIFTYSLPGRTTTQVDHHHYYALSDTTTTIIISCPVILISTSICSFWTYRLKYLRYPDLNLIQARSS